MNSKEYPNYKKLVEAHRKIRGDSSHPDYDKSTELEILMEKIKNLEFPTDTIDYNCPDSNNMGEIAGNTDNIQNQIDLDITKATISLIEERKAYEYIRNLSSFDHDPKDFKFWSDSIITLTGPLDFQTILMHRIYQRILYSDFTTALINCDFERCSFLAITAFLEGTFLKITLFGMQEVIKFISKIIQLLCDKIGEYTDRNFGNYFEIRNQSTISKIIAAVLTILVSNTCLGDQNRKSNNDIVKFAGVGFSAFRKSNNDIAKFAGVRFPSLLSMCFSWVIAIPINTLTGKAIKIWNDLRSENRSILWKSMVITRELFKQFPLISFFTNLILPELPSSNTSSYPLIKKVDDIFKCQITQELLLDPVTLHGFVFERHIITKWLKKKKSHPFTRKYASTNHIAEPPIEYTESFQNYINRLIAQTV